MKKRLTRIRILSDGRPGHENQSLGLAEALRHRTGADVECVRLDLHQGLRARINRARSLTSGRDKPELLIGAGHRTHLPMMLAAWKFRAKAVVIMKPSLPLWFFDLCLVPRHDLRGAVHGAHIVATQGALNRLPESVAKKTAAGVILIGGPSKHHNWSGAPLLAAIREIVGRKSELSWTVANSRRTPERFLREVEALGLPVKIVPHEKTTPGWLPSTLMAAEDVWVTEDSTSMIFEAITARARVGLLPLPAKRSDGRMIRAVDEVIASGYAVRYADWLSKGMPSLKTEPLHEAGRCADEVLSRLFDYVR
ncbi:MAG TPA: ELM1/GtrOC1 family putative glycosyltransferase [Rariglobus sp.]|jgi:mitochondrial fission protein ELM1|nr:ELM1/GtrOC1 family putative glycosyltransferase [Rariglobus sp.]